MRPIWWPRSLKKGHPVVGCLDAKILAKDITWKDRKFYMIWGGKIQFLTVISKPDIHTCTSITSVYDPSSDCKRLLMTGGRQANSLEPCSFNTNLICRIDKEKKIIIISGICEVVLRETVSRLENKMHFYDNGVTVRMLWRGRYIFFFFTNLSTATSISASQ